MNTTVAPPADETVFLYMYWQISPSATKIDEKLVFYDLNYQSEIKLEPFGI